MRNKCTLGVVSFFVLLGACASQHSTHDTVDEQIDLYLSTLDDKHFVWCELDLEQCRRDFEAWELTQQGFSIIKEFEREKTDQPDNIQHIPNVFRTRFVEDDQLGEETVDKDGKGQSFDRDPNGLSMDPRMHGPQSLR